MEPVVQYSKENYSKGSVLGMPRNTVIFLPVGQQNHVLYGQHLLFFGHSLQLSSL